MSKKFIKLSAACVLTAVLMYAAGGLQPQAAAAVSTPIKAQETVEQQVQRWVDELSEQSSFASWKKSTLIVSPIGPGTHSWLALVVKDKKTVGYLVINAIENGGYQLGEYGTNSHPLFDESTLSGAIKQLELIQPVLQIEKLYIHPLLAAWSIKTEQETFYADAASGEQLPADKDDWKIDTSSTFIISDHHKSSKQSKLLKHVSLPSFNPYATLPWIKNKPLILSKSSNTDLLAKINKKEQLRYTAELFNGQMLFVWSVVGYNKWDNDQLFIALEAGEDGSDRRYIPLPLLTQLGSFYR